MEQRYDCDDIVGADGTHRLSTSTELLLDHATLEQGEECPLHVEA